MFILKSTHERIVKELRKEIDDLAADNALAQQCIKNQYEQISAHRMAKRMRAKNQKRDNNGRFSK
tara:strand:- start:775 stop:969 length:195 start_codon:yes stop_codon:yes gene_type:complete